MDQITHCVRLENWKAVIEKCQARPNGQSAKQWLADNGISDKQYYYWLRKVRSQVYEEKKTTLPVCGSSQITQTSLIEIPAGAVIEDDHDYGRPQPAVTIRTKKATLEITTAVPDALIFEIVKAVRHAL